MGHHKGNKSTPSQQAYKLQGRREINKARKAKKQAKIEAKHKEKRRKNAPQKGEEDGA
jgi:hypothetical protein